jgi:hypothetical protein
MATVEDVRQVAAPLPRAYEVLVRDRVKFRVGQIVFAALSRDETILGFGYPKDERAARLAAEPELFVPPDRSDERYHWLQLRLDRIDPERLRELIIDAWLMVVPKRVGAAYVAAAVDRPEASAK